MGRLERMPEERDLQGTDGKRGLREEEDRKKDPEEGGRIEWRRYREKVMYQTSLN